jgi:alkylhydroperoxidase family enzyme
LAQHELTEEDYANVANWATYDGYSEAERLAIEYTEKFAVDHMAIDQSLIDRLVEHYGEDLLMDMTISVGCWIAFGRLNEVFGAEVSCPIRL